MVEKARALDASDATVLRGASVFEDIGIWGRYKARCIKPNGKTRWSDDIENVVCTQGKNTALDAFLAGSGYTVTGPFMGLISSVGYSSVPVVGDTMASHATWVEAGFSSNFPLYTGSRKTMSWNAAAAGSKASNGTTNFVIVTTGGTVKGCFICFGAGAVNTIGDSNGSLWSAGLFTLGDKVVGVGDTVQVTYSTGM